MLVLAAESSCDETAVALVTGDRRIVEQRIASQQAGSRVPLQVNSSFQDGSRPPMLPPQLRIAGRIRCC